MFDDAKKLSSMGTKTDVTGRSCNMSGARATYLFSVPGWLQGVGQLWNLSGTGFIDYNSSPSEVVADRRAMYQDFAAVGDDLASAARKLI